MVIVFSGSYFEVGMALRVQGQCRRHLTGLSFLSQSTNVTHSTDLVYTCAVDSQRIRLNTPGIYLHARPQGLPHSVARPLIRRAPLSASVKRPPIIDRQLRAGREPG